MSVSTNRKTRVPSAKWRLFIGFEKVQKDKGFLQKAEEEFCF